MMATTNKTLTVLAITSEPYLKSNDIIAGNGRVLDAYMFIIWLYTTLHNQLYNLSGYPITVHSRVQIWPGPSHSMRRQFPTPRSPRGLVVEDKMV